MLRLIATFFLTHLLMGESLGHTIQGLVTDSKGAAIPGVSITARNIAGGLPRPVITGEAGKYLLPWLKTGAYVLMAELPGFEVELREVLLISDIPTNVDFHLRVAQIGDCPGVNCGLTPQAPLRQSSSASAISKSEIAERIVGSVWNFSMSRAGVAPGHGRLSPEELLTKAIMKELHDLGRDVLPALILGLQDPAVQLRQNAAFVLLSLGGGFSGETLPKIDIRETLPTLIAMLDDSDGLVRAWSAQAIGQIGPDAAAAVSALMTLLANADEGSRISGCIALRQIGPAASPALPALQRALNDSSADVRRFAQLAIDVIQKK
jgi:hypothetical protein